MATSDQSKRRSGRPNSGSLSHRDISRFAQILDRAEQHETKVDDRLEAFQKVITELQTNNASLQTTIGLMKETIEEAKKKEGDLVKRVSKLENICMYIYAVGTVLVAVGMLTTWAINTGRFFTGGGDRNDKNVPQDIFMYAPLDRGKHHQLPEQIEGGSTPK